MTRLLLVLAALVVAAPLYCQPVPEGDEIRVREEKKAPWSEGLYVRNDSTSLLLAQDGIERAYELLAIERVEWKAPRNLPLELLLGTAGGAAVGLMVEAFSLLATSGCFDILEETGECNEDWGKAAGIGAAAGASWVLISYAIWPRRWKNVTKHYPPAGTQH